MSKPYSSLWAAKMKSTFASLDTDKAGYLTLDRMNEVALSHAHHFPGLKADYLLEHTAHCWKYLFHCGKDCPSDKKLTEEEYIDNMWITVNQPNFNDEVKRMCADTFTRMDLNQDGRLTRAEFLKMNGMRASTEHVNAAFDAMDQNEDGSISFGEFVKSKVFFYTDTSNPTHPFNLINGPLE